MLRRKIRNRHDAEECLSAVSVSGLSRVDWARTNGVNARSLNMWRLNIMRGERHASPSILHLVELVPSEQPERLGYLIRVGSYEIEVNADFDEGALRRILGVLRAC